MFCHLNIKKFFCLLFICSEFFCCNSLAEKSLLELWREAASKLKNGAPIKEIEFKASTFADFEKQKKITPLLKEKTVLYSEVMRSMRNAAAICCKKNIQNDEEDVSKFIALTKKQIKDFFTMPLQVTVKNQLPLHVTLFDLLDKVAPDNFVKNLCYSLNFLAQDDPQIDHPNDSAGLKFSADDKKDILKFFIDMIFPVQNDDESTKKQKMQKLFGALCFSRNVAYLYDLKYENEGCLLSKCMRILPVDDVVEILVKKDGCSDGQECIESYSKVFLKFVQDVSVVEEQKKSLYDSLCKALNACSKQAVNQGLVEFEEMLDCVSHSFFHYDEPEDNEDQKVKIDKRCADYIVPLEREFQSALKIQFESILQDIEKKQRKVASCRLTEWFGRFCYDDQNKVIRYHKRRVLIEELLKIRLDIDACDGPTATIRLLAALSAQDKEKIYINSQSEVSESVKCCLQKSGATAPENFFADFVEKLIEIDENENKIYEFICQNDESLRVVPCDKGEKIFDVLLDSPKLAQSGVDGKVYQETLEKLKERVLKILPDEKLTKRTLFLMQLYLLIGKTVAGVSAFHIVESKNEFCENLSIQPKLEENENVFDVGEIRGLQKNGNSENEEKDEEMGEEGGYVIEFSAFCQKNEKDWNKFQKRNPFFKNKKSLSFCAKSGKDCQKINKKNVFSKNRKSAKPKKRINVPKMLKNRKLGAKKFALSRRLRQHFVAKLSANVSKS